MKLVLAKARVDVFAHPWLLLLLLAAAAAGLAAGGAARRRRWSFPRCSRCARSGRRGVRASAAGSRACCCSALALLIVALARPQLGQDDQPRAGERHRHHARARRFALDARGGFHDRRRAREPARGGEAGDREVHRRPAERSHRHRRFRRAGRTSSARSRSITTGCCRISSASASASSRTAPRSARRSLPRRTGSRTRKRRARSSCCSPTATTTPARSRPRPPRRPRRRSGSRFTRSAPARAATRRCRCRTCLGGPLYRNVKVEVDEETLRKIAEIGGRPVLPRDGHEDAGADFRADRQAGEIDRRAEPVQAVPRSVSVVRSVARRCCAALLGCVQAASLDAARTRGEESLPLTLSRQPHSGSGRSRCCRSSLALFFANEARRAKLLRQLVAARLQDRLAGTVSVGKRRLRFALLLLGAGVRDRQPRAAAARLHLGAEPAQGPRRAPRHRRLEEHAGERSRAEPARPREARGAGSHRAARRRPRGADRVRGHARFSRRR